MAETEYNDAELRELVWRRCGAFCERCGAGMLPDDMAVHHRKLRSRGGRNTIVNAMGVHHRCHNGHDQAIHNQPEESKGFGYMVSAFHDPALIPVLLFGRRGFWVELTPEGTYSRGVSCLECNDKHATPQQARRCGWRDKVQYDIDTDLPEEENA